MQRPCSARGGICRIRNRSLRLTQHRTRVRFPPLLGRHFAELKFVVQFGIGAVGDSSVPKPVNSIN
jgi:hypothetical protein